MSYVFSGAERLISTPAAKTAHDISIVCWFKTSVVNDGHILVSNTGEFGSIKAGFEITCAVGDQSCAANCWNNDVEQALSTTSISSNTWTHFAGTFEKPGVPTYRYAYMDGGNKGSNTVLQVPNSTYVERVCIGDRSPTSHYYANGKIAEVAIWGVLLTDEEVATLAAGAVATDVQPGNLLRYWPLVDDLLDLSGNDKHLSVDAGSPTADAADHPIGAAPPIAPSDLSVVVI
jgi:hypothetical protein